LIVIGGRKLVTGALLLCCPAALQAADWSFNPAAHLTMGYDSNAALRTIPHETTSYVTFLPRLTIRRTTETSGVNLGLLARATSYAASEYENTHEERIDLSSYVQTTERTKLDLKAFSLWDTLFQSVVIETDTGDSQDVDIGLVTTKVSRNRRQVQPSVVYALTERGSVALRYRLIDVLFDDVGTTGLVDYQQHFLSGTYTYRLTDTNDLLAVAQGAQFRPAVGNDSDTTALLAGIAHKFSETARAGFQAGVGKSTETLTDGSQVDTSIFVLEARASQLSELSRLDALISRDVLPSGSGRSVSTDQLRVFWDRKLSPITRLRFRTKVFRNQALESAVNTTDRRYAEAQLGLNWNWVPEWSFGVAYSYRYQKYDVNADSAQSNGVSATLSWAPPQRK
jgi:hypothetical protein